MNVYPKSFRLFPTVILSFWFVISFSSQVYNNNLSKLEDTTKNTILELQRIKLESEIEKLRTETEIASSRWPKLAQAAPFMTAIVALVGVFITIWKYLDESSRQRELDRRQLESEKLRRFDEKFMQIVEGLGAQQEPVRAGAAVSILNYLKPEYSNFHEQVFLILLANLRIDHNAATNTLLVKAFEHSIRIKAKEVHIQNTCIEENEDKISLDISQCNIPMVHLPKIDLSWANLQQSKLCIANFKGATLQRLKAQKADLSEAQISHADLRKAVFDDATMRATCFSASDLRWVHFKNADLQKARFQRALLQSALFNGADLRGASFEQADINNAFFNGAVFDNAAMMSIIKAHNWQDKAHFDKEVYSELNKLQRQKISKEQK